MEHHDVADAHDDVARSFLRQLRREFLLLFFELHKFDLHQFMLCQRRGHRTNETVTQAGFANLQHRFQQLRGRFEFTDLRISQGFEH